jgi:hypothetical protein
MSAMTWKNRLLNIFIRQLRKNHNSLFLAAQDFMLIDKSMLWQIDVEIQDAQIWQRILHLQYTKLPLIYSQIELNTFPFEKYSYILKLSATYWIIEKRRKTKKD